MNPRNFLFALFFIILAVAGCKSDKSTSSEFTDSLILGTGIGGNGFDIIGETTTFTGSPVIYWRLESAEDMKGSMVDIQISKSGWGVLTFRYTNPQSYGHIMLSSFPHTYGTGSFRVTGRLTTPERVVAYKDYTVK